MPVSWISRPSYLRGERPWEGRLIQEPNHVYTGVNCIKDLSHLHWGDIKHSRASTTEDVRCRMLLQRYGGHILHFTPSSKIGGKFSQTNGSLVAINYCFIKCLHLMYVRIYTTMCELIILLLPHKLLQYNWPQLFINWTLIIMSIIFMANSY